MVHRIRRVVTGHDKNGKSVFIMDGKAPNVLEMASMPGVALTDLWRTKSSPASNSGNADAATGKIKLEPPSTGTILRIVEFPPDSKWRKSADASKAFASIDAGGAPDRASSDAMMHATATVDYIIVLKGEIYAILDKGAFDLKRILEFEPDFLEHGHDHDHEEEVKSLSFTADRPVDPDKFQKWMGAVLQLRGPDIFRSKGILAIDGAPKRYVYQGVHMMMDADWGTPWKEGEKRSSKLVFIGRNLDGENLKRGFEECLK